MHLLLDWRFFTGPCIVWGSCVDLITSTYHVRVRPAKQVRVSSFVTDITDIQVATNAPRTAPRVTTTMYFLSIGDRAQQVKAL